MAGALGVAVLVRGGGAVEDERATALGDVAQAQRVGQDRLAAAGRADDQRHPAGVDRVERVGALERPARIGRPHDHPARRPAPARRQRDAVRDVPLRVAPGSAQLVDAERQRGREPGQAQPPAADHAGVREGVKLGGGLLDGALELLERGRAGRGSSSRSRPGTRSRRSPPRARRRQRRPPRAPPARRTPRAGRGAPCRAPRRAAASTVGVAAPARERGRPRRCGRRASPEAGSTAGARARTGRCARAAIRGAGSPRASRRRGAASRDLRRRRSRTRRPRSTPSPAGDVRRAPPRQWWPRRLRIRPRAPGDRTPHRPLGAGAPTAARASAFRRAR